MRTSASDIRRFRKPILLTLTLLSAAALTTAVFADESEKPAAQTENAAVQDQGNTETPARENTPDDNPFASLDSSDQILPLEDGGFLIGSGQVEIYSLDDLEHPTDVIDLDNNPDTVTPEEACSLFNER